MKKAQQIQRVTYICQLCFSIFNVPVIFMNPHDEAVGRNFYFQQNPLVNLRHNPQILFPNTSLTKKPYFIQTDYYENYFAINVILSNRYNGKIIVGPAISSKINQQIIESFFINFKNPIHLKSAAFQYYAHLPVIDSKLWAKIASLIYYLLYHEEINILDLDPLNHYSKTLAIKESLDSYLTEQKQNYQFHYTEQFSKILLQAIKEDNRDKVLEQLSKTPEQDSIH